MSWQSFAFWYCLNIFNYTPELRVTDVDRFSDRVADLAAKFSIREVCPKATSVEVDDTNTLSWTILWIYVKNSRLRVVGEPTSEICPSCSVCSHFEVDVTIEGITFGRSWHWTPNLVPTDSNWGVDCTIEHAFWICVSSETSSRDEDVTSSAIRWSTPWERSINLVQNECEAIVVVVHTVEGHLELHLVTLGPSTWSNALNVCIIQPGSWHNL